MKIWPQLLERLHPQDRPAPPAWQRGYETKFAVAHLLKPQRILEIGVRTGYSAYAFLSASPQAHYRGIDPNADTHGGFRGAIEHARNILAPFDADVLELSSRQFATWIPERHAVRGYDLIHVDGDHTEAGCAFDLDLAWRIGFRHLLVDDYAAIHEVRQACEQFFAAHERELTRLVLEDGHNGAVLFSRCAAE